jgi:hypothetical protein
VSENGIGDPRSRRRKGLAEHPPGALENKKRISRFQASDEAAALFVAADLWLFDNG